MLSSATIYDKTGMCAFFVVLAAIFFTPSGDCRAAKRLQWEKKPEEIWTLKTYDRRFWHEEAVDYCRKLTLDHHYDWRLPTLDELKTLLNISAGRRFYVARVARGIYWSSTPYDEDRRRFWALSFISEQAGPMTVHNYNRVVCVRTVRE